MLNQLLSVKLKVMGQTLNMKLFGTGVFFFFIFYFKLKMHLFPMIIKNTPSAALEA